MSQAGANGTGGGGGAVVETLTGNSGVATSVANNINVVTANATVKFVGAGSTLTQDFGLGNLILGNSASSITSANNNVGVGNLVFNLLTSGGANIAVGTRAGNSITSAAANTLVGHTAGLSLTTSQANTAVGASALANFTSGAASTGSNTAVGNNALNSLATGINNTSVGDSSLLSITTGSYGIAIGYQAGINHTTTDSSNIDIGNTGTAGQSNTIRIGTQGTGNGQQNQCYLAGVLNTVSGRVVNVTSPSVYPYTTLVSDYVITVSTTSGRTVNLIASPVTGTTYRIKDKTGQAAANNITIMPIGKTIDGAGSVVINNNYGSMDVVFNGTEWNIF